MMRLSIRTGFRAAKWTLAMVVAALAIASNGNEAQAHFFRYHFGTCGLGYHGLSYGGFGYGGVGYCGLLRPFRSCYTSYYTYSTPYYYAPAPVYYYAPRVYTYDYCVPYVSAPIYTTPNCAPFFSGVNYDTAYPITAQSSPSAWRSGSIAKSGISVTPSSVATRSVSQRNAFAMQPSPTLLASTQKSKNAPLMMLRHPEPAGLELATIDKTQSPDLNVVGKHYVARKPAVLQPYSPIWTQAATGLVDDMIAAGQLEDAAASCKSMEKIEQAKGAGVYLRQGLLGFISDASNVNPAGLDKALNLLDLACATGSELQPTELPKASLREYFSKCSVDIDQVMEKLSQTILETPSKTGREMLMLTVLLRMDGQTERASLFADEAMQMAAKSGAFRWNNLLTVCHE